MELIVDSEPFLLYETISMVYSYVNEISILSTRDRMSRTLRGQYDDDWYRRLGRLQEIQATCCKDLDPDDEAVLHFFRRMSMGCSSDYTYLAGILTISFMQFRKHDLAGEIRSLKDNWMHLLAEGYTLSELGACGLNISPRKPGEAQKALSQQIYELKYPAELRLEILNALLNYDTELDRLADLLRPYAMRLEAHLKAEPWLMATTVSYWRTQFETISPESFVNSKKLDSNNFPALETQRVCFLLMDCAQLFFYTSDDQDRPGNGLFIFGCAIRAESILRHRGRNQDWILATLRSISDKNKFELLRRLSREQSYCQKLAEELDCHPGNVSRNLTTLWKEGFLIREERDNRIYYETDRARISSFLEELQEWMTGPETD